MGFTIQQGKEQVQAAHRFQMSAELQDVALLDCSAFSSQGSDQSGGQLQLGLEMEPSVITVSEGMAKFAVSITVFGDPKATTNKDAVEHETPEKPAGHLFKVMCRFGLRYRLRPSYTPPEHDVDAFKNGNAVFHCWPYTRELVQNLTMRMGLQIPPLPLLRIGPKPESKKPTASRGKSSKVTLSDKDGSPHRPEAIDSDASSPSAGRSKG